MGTQVTAYFEDYIDFDLETTGLYPDKDSIIEIGAVKVRDHEVVDQLDLLVNPGVLIPTKIVQLTGITDEMVKDAPGIADALVDFYDFIGDDVIVGHNIQRFDIPFVKNAAEKCGKTLFINQYMDTLPLSQALYPEMKSHSEEALDGRFGVINQGAHRSVNDCMANQHLYEIMGKEFEARKQTLHICPKCGNLLLKRKGKYGDFLGCNNYPECRYTENIS